MDVNVAPSESGHIDMLKKIVALNLKLNMRSNMPTTCHDTLINAVFQHYLHTLELRAKSRTLAIASPSCPCFRHRTEDYKIKSRH